MAFNPLDKLAMKKVNAALNHIQSRISWGLPYRKPDNLTERELEIWNNARYETQLVIVLELEKMKWKKNGI